jgi:hypothetical protein
MKAKTSSRRLPAAATYSFAIAFMLSIATVSAWAGENTLFTFNGNNGANPTGTLILDAEGNLYGVTGNGGTTADCSGQGCGTVFKLTRSSTGAWSETILHRFVAGSDGDHPTSLIMDSAGDLYGTTGWGGGNGGDNCNGLAGCGVVFKLSHRASGPWPETILYRFSGTDGAQPSALAFDGLGNLYGITTAGGGGSSFCADAELMGCGILFQLIPASGGSWTLSTLHTFTDSFTDATGPVGLVVGSGGVIYGISASGGSSGLGTIFQLAPVSGGGWDFSILHSFGAAGDGTYPNTGVILDSSGNLYGTTSEGGSERSGVAWELSPGPGGIWTENILYTFQFGTGGFMPDGVLTFDASGNLYGTTYYGAGTECADGCGVTFKLTPSGSGTWAESVAFRFVYTNGAHPMGGLVRDSRGNFYGTALEGGAEYDGVVFQFTP